MSDEFKNYINNVVINTKACRDELYKLGDIVSDTDNHLFLLNTLASFNLNGLEAQKKLEEIFITTNKNMLPNDTLKPNKTSGLRLGFAAVTTRGATKDDAIAIAHLIHDYLKGNIDKGHAKKLVKDIVSNWKKIENI